MPTDTIRKQPPKKGSGKGKIGGISWQWWAAGLVVAIGVGLYLRNKSASSAAASPATAATPVDTSGGVGGASGYASGVDTTGLQDAINNLGSATAIGGGGGILSQPSGAPDPFAPDPFAQPAPGRSNPPAPTAPPPPSAPRSTVTTTHGATGVPFSAPGSRPGETINLSTGIASLASGTRIVGPQRTPPSDVNPGNVVGFKVLPSGATLTTLSSGRQIEQAPGKSPYVVHK